MLILHTSDTHGTIPPWNDALDQCDIIVHSGDFMPTKGRRAGERIRPRAEYLHQERWVHENGPALAAWTRGKPFLFVPGNHDFYPCVPSLRDAGVDARDICERTETVDGVSFYGFPWVPYLEGEWSREAQESDIAEHAMHIPNVDVLVSHAPMFGWLDVAEDRHLGSASLAREYFYRRDRADWPSLLLCGHIHESFGVKQWDRMTIVNSATGHHLVMAPEPRSQ